MPLPLIRLSNDICPDEETFIKNVSIRTTKSGTVFTTVIHIFAEKFVFVNLLKTVLITHFFTPSDKKTIMIAVDEDLNRVLLCNKFLKIMRDDTMLTVNKFNINNCIITDISGGDILIIVNKTFEFLGIAIDVVNSPYLVKMEYEKKNGKYNIGTSTVSVDDGNIKVETKQQIDLTKTYKLHD